MRKACLIIVASVAMAVAGCTKAAEDPAFGDKVRAYLLAHPEVIQEAVEKLQEKKDAEAATAAKAALQTQRQALERDLRDFVANPTGRITVTEFYDYRCPHCINAAPAVLGIIHDNPDVRFVFKELPIFGAISEHAARAAIAVKAAGGDYVGFYRTLMQTKGLNDQTVDRLVRGYGVDPAAIEHADIRDKADAQLADVHKLAEALDIEGTPTFVVGDTFVAGGGHRRPQGRHRQGAVGGEGGLSGRRLTFGQDIAADAGFRLPSPWMGEGPGMGVERFRKKLGRRNRRCGQSRQQRRREGATPNPCPSPIQGEGKHAPSDQSRQRGGRVGVQLAGHAAGQVGVAAGDHRVLHRAGHADGVLCLGDGGVGDDAIAAELHGRRRLGTPCRRRRPPGPGPWPAPRSGGCSPGSAPRGPSRSGRPAA